VDAVTLERTINFTGRLEIELQLHLKHVVVELRPLFSFERVIGLDLEVMFKTSLSRSSS
jgi:hypothetical protein